MCPRVRQLTTRWPELEHEPAPRTQNQADAKPTASTTREPAPRPAGAPRYKLALLTWAGAYAVITAILATLGPTAAAWPLVLRTLLLSALMVLALTWLIMPALTRLFRAWLAASD
jgi:antibiotic biosynthesis monooxygenase (ABM) superfamily enzyme